MLRSLWSSCSSSASSSRTPTPPSHDLLRAVRVAVRELTVFNVCNRAQIRAFLGTTVVYTVEELNAALLALVHIGDISVDYASRPVTWWWTASRSYAPPSPLSAELAESDDDDDGGAAADAATMPPPLFPVHSGHAALRRASSQHTRIVSVTPQRSHNLAALFERC